MWALYLVAMDGEWMREASSRGFAECASKHSGWRISHTVLVQQCDKHQLLLFILLAVMQPSRYYRLSSLDSVLMCYNFYLIYYVFWVEMWNLHIKCKNAECLNDRNIHSAQITNGSFSLLWFGTDFSLSLATWWWNIFFCIRLKDTCFESWKTANKCQVVASKLLKWFWNLQEPHGLVFLWQEFRGSPSQERHHSRMFLWGKRNNVFLCSLLWVNKPNKHYFLLVKKLRRI